MTNFLRKYGLVMYWLMFVPLTLYQARHPGLMLNPEQWQYPWRAVLVVCVLLAIFVGILQLILRPKTFNKSWGRLLIALMYSGFLMYGGFASVYTDLPGCYYVPAQFAVINMGVILILAGVLVFNEVLQRLRKRA